MNGWVIFTLSMALPGFAEMYAAIMLIPFVRKAGGILPFLFCLLSGLFDLGFSAIMVLIFIFDGNLVIDLDLTNPIILSIVIAITTSFFSWRISSSLISLWFAGLVKEDTIRTVTRIKKLPN